MGQEREEIEDVLSSVRRLVAGEASRREGAPALVLDEAARVSEPEDPYRPVGTVAEPDGADDPAPERDPVEDPSEAPAETALEGFDCLVQEEMDDNDAALIDAPAATGPRFDVPPPIGLMRMVPGDDDDLPEPMPGDEGDESGRVDAVDPWEAAPRTPAPDGQADVASDTGEGDAANAMADIDLSDRLPVRDGHVSAEALRELIAEVVREELSGELGERITRNVRKLVRREIRKALAADEFE